MSGLETVSLSNRDRQETELEEAEMKMLRFSLGETGNIRHEQRMVRGTAKD